MKLRIISVLRFTSWKVIYAVLSWISLLTSLMCVMLCFRIIIAVQLVPLDEMHGFVVNLSDTLLRPIKYNVFTVGALPACLIVFAIEKLGWVVSMLTAIISFVIFSHGVHMPTARTIHALAYVGNE